MELINKKEDTVKAIRRLVTREVDWHDCDLYDKAKSSGDSYLVAILDAIDVVEDMLTVEPKIDKDALIRLIQGAVEDGEDCRRLIEMVESRWIPCSERLPEENGKSYLTYQCGDDIRYGWCQVLRYYDGWNCLKGDKENEIKLVVAWMPLPMPWKGADNE